MKLTLQLLFILVLISCVRNNGQEDFVLTITNGKTDDSSDSLILDITILNNTDSSYLLYAFGLCHEELANGSDYTKDLNFPSGLALVIRDNDDEPLPQYDPEIDFIDSVGLNEMKKETEEVYMNSMINLRAGDSHRSSKKFRMVYHRLEPGEYNISVIYYSGKHLVNFVSSEIQKRMETRENAITFKGWIISNTIKLNVK